MAYQKYSTEAIVLRSYERGEADRVFALFTRDFGFVWARASAVRRERSRMRYALQHYARANVSLVRGNKGWRATGATSRALISAQSAGSVAFARIAQLVERLVAGEEKNEYLFTTLCEAHVALVHEPAEIQATIELVCVARILFALGYLSAEALGTDHTSFSAENVRDPASPQAPALRRGPNPVSLFTHTSFSEPHLVEATAVKDELLKSVNRAIAETHL